MYLYTNDIAEHVILPHISQRSSQGGNETCMRVALFGWTISSLGCRTRQRTREIFPHMSVPTL